MLLLLPGARPLGLGIWCRCPQTQWYMGLSGLLHGLLVWGAMQGHPLPPLFPAG